MGKNFFWMDLEMTGLDENQDQILEIAAIVTDTKFETKATLDQIVFQPPAVLETMNDWCKQHHGASGLTAAVPNGTPLNLVEDQLIALVDQFYKGAEKVVICGNSIGNDRRFIDKYLPRFAARLHYRMVDVSSFKEIYRDVYGVKFEKSNKHRAIDDILESIRELQHYLSFVKV